MPPRDAVFAAAPFAQLLFTPDLVILSANPRHCAMTGRRAGEVVGRFMFDAFPKNPRQEGPDTEDVIRASVARVIETRAPDEPPLQKHDLQRDDGSFEERYWQITHAPVEEDGEVTAILQISRDVTAETLSRRITEAQQRAAMRGADLGFFEYDLTTDRFVRTGALDKMFGFAPGEGGEYGKPFFARMVPGHADAVLAEIERVAAAPERTVARFDYEVERPDGERRWATFRGEIVRDPVNQAPTLVGVVLDVTDLKKKEAGLEAALTSREDLLDEVNHRVKNSLQLVTSILRLEAGAARGTAAEERLRAATDRVQAVASVHASLYHTDDVRSVEMKRFLPGFCENLAATRGSRDRGIALATETDDLRLGTDRAIALALIVNELVTDALGRESAAGGRSVTVAVKRVEDGAVLTVEDDGAARTSSALLRDGARTAFGSTLIDILVRQLGATLTRKEEGDRRSARLVLPALR